MNAAYHNKSPESCSPSVPARDSLPPVPGHLSGPQIAALNLPGLPASRRRIDELAKREGWPYIVRAGRGGGRLYATSALPEQARAVLFDRLASTIKTTARRGRPAGLDWFANRPEVAAAVEQIWTERRLAAPRILELLAHYHADLPSARTLQRYIARFDREKRALIDSIRNPDLFKSRHRVSLGSVDAGVTYANEVWELDTTPADVLTIGGRKAILGLIDRYSRRANFMVAESESGQSVRNILIETIRKWGVMPTAVMTDNGSGYINQSIRSALDALGIEHRICPPGSPEKKPYIERLFGTFTRERAELLAGYAGHSVADAQALRAKARKDTGRAEVVAEMTPVALQDVLTNWVDGVYAHRHHGTIRMTPMARYQASTVPVRRAPGEDVLRLALSALVGQRKVGKRGIVWQGGRYWAPALAAWVGRDVMVRRDEEDLGELFIFAPDGTFIDCAVDHTRAGLSEQQYAEMARHQQAKQMTADRAELRRRSKDFDFATARDALLRRDAEAAGKLSYLTPATITASTPMIDSLTEAAAPAPVTHSAPHSAVVIAMPATARGWADKSAEQRMVEADEIIERAAAGAPVDPDKLAAMRRYTATSEYRAQRALTDHFTPQTGGLSA